MTDLDGAARRCIPRPIVLVAIGLVAGLCSGMFGVGGGLLIVPGLVLLAQYPQKLASGTSLLALTPVTAVGVAAYGSRGAIDWDAALTLAAGVVAGGVVGTRFARRVPTTLFTVIFSALLVAAGIRLILGEPTSLGRASDSPTEIAVLLGTGVLVGLLSGLVGAGAGVLIVPSLVLVLGFDNLVARGVSLLAVLPNGLVAGLLHLRRGDVDVRAALTIGAAGAVSVVVGSTLAAQLSGDLGAVLFGCFLFAIAAQLIVRTIRGARTR